MASQEEKKFGLPNTESFEPIKNNNRPIKIFISILLFIGLGVAVYWFYFRKERISNLEANIGLKKNHEAFTEDNTENDPIILESFESKPKIGEITLINEITGKYYIVIGSFIDEDLAMDYAKKLVKDDIGVYLINSIKKKRYTYLAVDSSDKFEEAKQIAKDLSSKYPKGAWVISY
jgi:hypothetical protein